MKEEELMNDVFKYLYERFLFRDLLSFVVPGAIALYGILRVLGYSTHTILEHLISFPWPLDVGLWGLLFSLGFGVQALGLLCRIIRLEPKGSTPKDVYRQRRRLRAAGL